MEASACATEPDPWLGAAQVFASPPDTQLASEAAKTVRPLARAKGKRYGRAMRYPAITKAIRNAAYIVYTSFCSVFWSPVTALHGRRSLPHA